MFNLLSFFNYSSMLNIFRKHFKIKDENRAKGPTLLLFSGHENWVNDHVYYSANFWSHSENLHIYKYSVVHKD